MLRHQHGGPGDELERQGSVGGIIKRWAASGPGYVEMRRHQRGRSGEQSKFSLRGQLLLHF